MAPLVDRLAALYSPNEQAFILTATKASAKEYLARLSQTIDELDDFDRFPEGELGVVVYAVLANVASQCPDIGDLGLVVGGVIKIVKAASTVVAEDTFDPSV